MTNQQIFDAALETAAKIADSYAEEAQRMCSDNIINDPVLANCRHGRLSTFSDFARSEVYQTDGLIASARMHCAQDIAAAIRLNIGVK